MYWGLGGLFLRAAGTTFIPWLIPFLYAAIGGLQTQGMDPILLSLVLRGGAIFGTSMLWIIDQYLDKYIVKRWPRLKQYKWKKDSRLHRFLKWMHNKLHVKKNKPILFGLSCFMTRTAIPDILIVRAVRKKLSFPVFILATLIGKSFVYTPVVFGVELLEMTALKFF